jgi:Na+/phosphate symporter
VVIKLKKYYNIIVEEVSDRVVVNILEGVQEEISEGGPVVDDIIEKVVKPKKELIVEWVSRRVGHAVEQDVLKKRAEISEYVRQLISESLSKNEELRTLEQVPVMGRRITETIQRSISDTINDIIEQALTDLASSRNRLLLKEMADVLINAIDYHDKEQEMDSIYSDIAIEIIDVVKKQVLVQKWKLKESSENGMNETEKDGVEFLLTDD